MPLKRDWIRQVERRVERWRAQGLGGVWVVAVSGGGDSVGLLRVLCQLAPAAGLRLSVAHLDHGARGEAAQADAAFVAELAAQLGLPFDHGQWRPTRVGHFEADARRARYTWLAEVARARAASVVAVGHNRDDQAETILHRIVRGTGPRGLTGMPQARRLARDPRVTLVRPLVTVSGCAIRDHLATLGQPFREDQTNADPARTRARIRHDLLPKLAVEYNPRVALALVRLGALAASMQRALATDLREMQRVALVTESPHCLMLRQGFLAAVPAFLGAEVLRRLWRRAGWPEAGMTARRWQRLAALAHKKQIPRIALGDGVEVSTEVDLLVLRRRPAPESGAPASLAAGLVAIDVPGSASVPWAGGQVVTIVDPEEPCDELIDFDRLSLPLLLRAPAPGDRFAPLGMGGKSMPLADFFRGQRVPRSQRARMPLVCDQSGIAWVVGHRIADRVKVTEQTRSTIGLRWLAGSA
jgi:tRNA(Ile)-lysidine synthase